MIHGKEPISVRPAYNPENSLERVEASASQPRSAQRLQAAGLLIILAAFVVLAIYYNVSNPLFEAPDELQHVAFVVWLMDERSLPVLDPEQPGPWEQEGTQTPLYYWLVATALGPFPHGAADSLAVYNPHANMGVPLRPDNKNRVLHDIGLEQWPYRGEILFPHLARFISTIMAVGSLLAIYRLGRIVFPHRPGIALGMVGLVAFIPQFLFLSSSVSNDNLVILLASWTLVLLAAWLRLPDLPSWRQMGLMGVLLGLAVLAKLSGLLLWPLVAGVLLWLGWRTRDVRWLVRAGIFCFAVALAVCGWWFARNYQVYGDLTGMQAHMITLGGPRQRVPSNPGAILAEFRGFRYSLWGLFGWFNILAPEPFYGIIDAMMLLGLLGFGIFLIRSRSRLPRSSREIILMLLAWFGLVAAAVVRWAVLMSSQGRLAFPALAAAALFLVVGWAELVPRRLRSAVGAAGLAGWAVWAAICPALVIVPAYALPERVASVAELPPDLVPIGVRYGDCCELVGYVSPEQPAHPGDWVPLTLVWRALEHTEEDYSLFVHAQTPDGQLAGQLDTYPGNGMYPTSQWQPGEIIVDEVAVPIRWEAPAPALLRFQVGLYDLGTGQELPAFSSEGLALETVFAGEGALHPFQWPEPQLDPAVETLFGQELRLVGADYPTQALRPGDVLTVTVQWEALAPVGVDLTGFVHLVDSTGLQVAQDDHPPLNGRFPTSAWRQGVVVEDTFRLSLPMDMSAGSYGLVAGLYHPESGERLAAISQKSGERWLHDLVSLGSVLIGPETEERRP